LGAWVLTVGWFGFNVMSAQTLDKISGLVAVNSLMAMVGGTLAALVAGKNDPGFVHNGPLAGLVAVCAGSDLMHPLGALVVGAVAGGLFVVMFTLTQNRWKIDDVLGVWPLHGLCGAWGGLAAGIFGAKALGGLGGVSLGAQAIGTTMGVAWAFVQRFRGLWCAEGNSGTAPQPGRGIRWRGPDRPPDQFDARPRSQLVGLFGVSCRKLSCGRRLVCLDSAVCWFAKPVGLIHLLAYFHFVAHNGTASPIGWGAFAVFRSVSRLENSSLVC
jgi:hypothetical protein